MVGVEGVASFGDDWYPLSIDSLEIHLSRKSNDSAKQGQAVDEVEEELEACKHSRDVVSVFRYYRRESGDIP